MIRMIRRLAPGHACELSLQGSVIHRSLYNMLKHGLGTARLASVTFVVLLLLYSGMYV